MITIRRSSETRRRRLRLAEDATYLQFQRLLGRKMDGVPLVACNQRRFRRADTGFPTHPHRDNGDHHLHPVG